MSQTVKSPWRTRLLVWLSVLAIVGVMVVVGGIAMAVLIVESAPLEP
jgi:hypothetical protein